MNAILILKKFSDRELDMGLKELVSKEREVLSQILVYIAEVDRRKLYLNMAYPSLFEYLTKHLGYSNGSAQRRIDAARLSREIPGVVDDLEKGKVNLMQISLLQKSVRQAYSETKSRISIKSKSALLDQLAGKSFSESQVLVAGAFDIQIKDFAKSTHQKDESVRLEVTLTKSQWKKLNRMRELLSTSLPNGSWENILEYVSNKVIAQKERSLFKTGKINANRKNEEVSGCTTQDNKLKGKQKLGRSYISMAVKREVFDRDKCCQYLDKWEGRKCGSHWQLNIDHIQPVWAGGSNDAENLRILCAKHNRFVYANQSNLRSRD